MELFALEECKRRFKNAMLYTNNRFHNDALDALDSIIESLKFSESIYAQLLVGKAQTMLAVNLALQVLEKIDKNKDLSCEEIVDMAKPAISCFGTAISHETAIGDVGGRAVSTLLEIVLKIKIGNLDPARSGDASYILRIKDIVTREDNLLVSKNVEKVRILFPDVLDLSKKDLMEVFNIINPGW